MRSFVALSAILYATSASSFIAIPLTKRQHTGSYLKEAAVAGRGRAVSLQSRTRPTTVPATNIAWSYTVRIGVGEPPIFYNLVVDTGSSNTFCGLGASYVQTSTSIATGDTVIVQYGSANIIGNEYLDQVTLAPNLTIANQSIGDALDSNGFPPGIDGILGLGPVDLTQGTLPSNYTATIPTIMNNLVSQGLIDHQILSVYFAPSTNYNDTNGVLTYGGIDSSLYEGELTYIPVTQKLPAGNFWGVDIALCTYGNYTIIPRSTSGIVDTGTTLVLLAEDYFSLYMSAIPGAKKDPTTGLLEIPTSSISSMQPLKFTLGDRVFTMDVNAQLFPADQNTALGGDPKKRYGTIGSHASESGEGLDFFLGMPFVERYYSVFDAEANRVGFAQTNNTFSSCQK